jgi:hypothetical protein
VVVREGKNVKGRVLALKLGTVGNGFLRKAFENAVKAIEARHDNTSPLRRADGRDRAGQGTTSSFMF